MNLLTAEIRQALPPLRSTEGLGMDAPIVVKFFTPTSNWTGTQRSSMVRTCSMASSSASRKSSATSHCPNFNRCMARTASASNVICTSVRITHSRSSSELTATPSPLSFRNDAGFSLCNDPPVHPCCELRHIEHPLTKLRQL